MAAVNYGTVAIVPKGEYDEGTQYNVGNLVSYNGSSYVAKMIPPVGTLPTDTSYWQLSAQGGGTATENDLGVVKPDNTTIGIEEDGTLKSILTSALLPSTDNSGILGQANATVNTQALIDAIADKIMTKLVTDDALTTRLANYVAKSMMTGVQVNSSYKVPTSALAYAMNELITGLRADVDSLNSRMFSQGVHEIRIIRGGDGINGNIYMQWLKIGRMVYISFAAWDFRILNPTNDFNCFSLPFINCTERAIGTMGFNSSGINMIPVSVIGHGDFVFCNKNQNGSTNDLRGIDIPTCTIQFNLIYVAQN